MNALSRPLFSAPPEMVEGSGITSMAMGEEQGMPMGGEQAALDIGGMIAGQLAAGIDQTERNIDAVAEDDTGGLMNALRDKNASVEDYRDELADIVGPKDAAATPESVLALVQPTLAMMEMEQGIGAMGGAMGDMGDMGAMGGMGEDMALMGDMGGGIGDMMPQGLPQGLPMPMGDDMVAVQEEVVGRMPPVEGMQRGGVVSIPAGKKSLPFDPNDPSVQHFVLGGTPTFDESVQERIAARQKYFGEAPLLEGTDKFTTALSMAAPFVTGLLTPKEQGGGIRGATAALSRAAVDELKSQKARERENNQRKFAQQQAIAQGAFASEEAARTAANLAKNRIDAAEASRVAKLPTVSNLGKLQREGEALQQEYDRNPSPALLQNIRQNKNAIAAITQTPLSETQMRNQSSVLSANATADTKALTEFGDEIKQQTQAAIGRAEKGRLFSKTMRDLETGPLTATLKGASDTIRQVASLAGFSAPQTDKFIKGLGGEDFIISNEKSSRLALLDELDKQYTILNATNVKGNLNQSEFMEVKDLGPSIRKRADANRRIIELYELDEKRGREKQRIYKEIFRSAPEGQSRRLTMIKIQDAIAAYEAEYNSEEANEKSRANRLNLTVPDYTGDIDVAYHQAREKHALLFSPECKEQRTQVIDDLMSFDVIQVNEAFRDIIGAEPGVEEGSADELRQFKHYLPYLKAVIKELGISEEDSGYILGRFQGQDD